MHRTLRPVIVAAVSAALGQASPQTGAVPGVGQLGGPARALTAVEQTSWLAGRALFDRDFRPSEGLGTPELNADSCRACHQDPVLGGAGALELNVTRFGFDNGGAGPFQNVVGGQGLSKLRPPLLRGREEHDPMVADVFEQRQTPALFGLGLIEAIPDTAILAREDPTDANGDGVFGVARWIEVAGVLEVGRFGWKAQVPRISDFVRDAFANECGLTAPDDGRGFALVADRDAVADPELTNPQLDQVTTFLALLAPPPRGGSLDPRIAQGEQLFTALGCAACHAPSLPSPDGPVALYSDLLLHQLMPPGFRGMAEPGASAGVYRTPPLWGVKWTAPYLHDGRADSLDAAILGHHGEGAGARAAYEAASFFEREALLLFLGDL